MTYPLTLKCGHRRRFGSTIERLWAHKWGPSSDAAGEFHILLRGADRARAPRVRGVSRESRIVHMFLTPTFGLERFEVDCVCGARAVLRLDRFRDMVRSAVAAGREDVYVGD